MTIAIRLGALALCASAGIAALSTQSRQTITDEYTRYELLAPDTASVKIMYEVSATTEGARTYVDPIPAGATVSDITVRDMITGEPLKFVAASSAITITLARPVPPKGQGRIRIEKTIKNPRAYQRNGDAGTLTAPALVHARDRASCVPAPLSIAHSSFP